MMRLDWFRDVLLCGIFDSASSSILVVCVLFADSNEVSNLQVSDNVQIEC